VLVLEAALLNKRYKPFTPSDAFTASLRVRFKFPYDAACALANYGCFCTAQLGFFSCHSQIVFMVLPKNLNPVISSSLNFNILQVATGI
jgi:hypothetical protein